MTYRIKGRLLREIEGQAVMVSINRLTTADSPSAYSAFRRFLDENRRFAFQGRINRIDRTPDGGEAGIEFLGPGGCVYVSMEVRDEN